MDSRPHPEISHSVLVDVGDQRIRIDRTANGWTIRRGLFVVFLDVTPDLLRDIAGRMERLDNAVSGKAPRERPGRQVTKVTFERVDGTHDHVCVIATEQGADVLLSMPQHYPSGYFSPEAAAELAAALQRPFGDRDA